MLQADPADFSPPLLRIQQKPPPPLAGWMLRFLIVLLAGLLLWTVFGRLDIVAVADGKLVPSSYLKIVQPAEQGIVKEILVKEGEKVEAAQVLIRMDAALTDADVKAIEAEYDNKRLALRRIDGQLAGRMLARERGEVAAQFERASQARAKLAHRQGLLELRAPQPGIVKDLATHTSGTVVAPGTILMTLVPEGDKLVAEVWVSNQDVGFVRPGQEAKLKLAAFQFQKYGLLQGKVLHVNADATEAPSPNTRSDALTGRDRPMGPLAFRALVDLASQELLADGERYALQPGMPVAGELHLATRSTAE